MHTRKIFAVVIAAALAVSLLFTGCGREDVAAALLEFFEGQYGDHITFTIDPELENTLRTIVNENDTIEEMLEDLEEKLGVTIDFESLRSGRKGDIAVALVFARNSRDVDGIIQQIFEALNPVLGTLRSSGEYQADMATVWADGGCYTVIRVTVEDSGRTPTYTPPMDWTPPPPPR